MASRAMPKTCRLTEQIYPGVRGPVSGYPLPPGCRKVESLGGRTMGAEIKLSAYRKRARALVRSGPCLPLNSEHRRPDTGHRIPDPGSLPLRHVRLPRLRGEDLLERHHEAVHLVRRADRHAQVLVIGGNGRPTSTPFFRNSSITGSTWRPMCTMKKFVSDGIDVVAERVAARRSSSCGASMTLLFTSACDAVSLQRGDAAVLHERVDAARAVRAHLLDDRAPARPRNRAACRRAPRSSRTCAR